MHPRRALDYDDRLLIHGILNPAINALLARVRHTNTLVIADRGFPFWPGLETVDISLVDDIPQVADVLSAVRANFIVGRIFMAEEFYQANQPEARRRLERAMEGATVLVEPHTDLKRRVPFAVGLIRTGDTTQYANLILESA
jgi:D-ribose pyranase